MKGIITIVSLFVLAVSVVASGANDFSADPNVQGLYLFENDLTDSSPAAGGNGANDLSDAGTIAFSGTCRQGSYSADFELDDSDRVYCADASLSAGFPGKAGTSNTTCSIAFWCYTESRPSSGATRFLLSKYVNTSGNRSFEVSLMNSSGVYTWRWLTYTSSGNEVLSLTPSNTPADGRWYHVAVTIDGSGNKTLTVYDVYNSCTDTAGGATAGGAILVGGSAFSIGASSQSIQFWDGLVDEVVVTNDVLTPTEIGYIRGGTYPTGPSATSPSRSIGRGIGRGIFR